jgi:16S rRNA (cytidine1402-2'-O)-methyltransferase
MSATRAGCLYVVATPIGNLADITLRALETLKQVDLVACEDTRHTRKLLTHFDIKKPLTAVHAHSTPKEIEYVVATLLEGKSVALVTDAGTPAVSDPGGTLVAAAVDAGVRVVPIPGASAVLSALVASGLSTDAGFRFFGFVSREGASRAEVLGRIAATPEPCVLYDAGNRVQDTLNELARAQPDRACAVARELTKLHEEIVRGTLAEVALARDTDGAPREWIGEVAIVLGAAEKQAEIAIDDDALAARIDDELRTGAHAKTAAERIAAWSGLPKREVYEKVVRRKQERSK